MTDPLVTIVVVPRDQFDIAPRALDTLLANTTPPFALVYVDGKSPRRTRRYVQDKARQAGFTVLRSARYLSPNEARNIGFREARTKYVVFVDNDVIVTPGWLEKLVGCAEETGAWVCGPLILWGEPEEQSIHGGAIEMDISEADGARIFGEERTMMFLTMAEAKRLLYRRRCDSVEGHCIFVRTDAFERIGAWDEQLLSLYEYTDLCLSVAAAGGEIYFEPESVVAYIPPASIAWADVPYFLLRWNEGWNRASYRHMREKWNFAGGPGLDAGMGFARYHRRVFLGNARALYHRVIGTRLRGLKERVVLPIERKLTAVTVRLTRGAASRGAPGGK